MEIYNYIKKIKLIIQEKQVYDSYRYIFKEYIQFLEGILMHDPSNIKAVCQLAIAYYEDRQDTDICIALMENALDIYEASMSKDNLYELLNNLAYFHDIEYGDTQKAENFLKRAIQLNSCYQSSYYALAYISVDSNPSIALNILNGIPQKENQSLNLQYLFGYVLLRNDLFDDVLSKLKSLMYCNDKEIVEKTKYCCALVYSITNRSKEALLIADELYDGYKDGTNEEILTFEMIYLYFQLKNYGKVIGLFGSEKRENIFVDVHIIKIYLYALKMQGFISECEKIYFDKLNELKKDIEEINSDEDFTKSEKIDYIKSSENDIEILKRNYNDIVLNNKSVEIEDIFYYCKPRKTCYLIDCPRHS